MNDHVIEEMADAISTELRVPNEDVLRILHHYWQDKIAPPGRSVICWTPPSIWAKP